MAKTRQGTTSIDIIAALKGSGIVTISEAVMFGDLNITQANIKCDGVIFNNCEIKGSLKFEDLSIKFGVQLIDCEIERVLYFTSFKIISYDSTFNRSNCSILIENSKIGASLSVLNCEFYHGIRFNNNAEIGNVSISNNVFENGGLSFRGIAIKTSCDIVNNQLYTGIDIYNSTIGTFTNIEMNKTTHLQFQKNRFMGDISLNNEETQHLSFLDGINEGDVSVTGLKINRTLNFKGNDFKSDVVITFANLKDKSSSICDAINVHSCSFGNGLYVTGNMDMDFIKTISINSTGKLSGEIMFRNFKVGLLWLKGINLKANIKILNAYIDKIEIEEFTNSSKVQLYDVKAVDSMNSIFKVKNSNLGVFEFYNTYLNSFKKILISKSILSDIITSNVKWFKQEQLGQEVDYPEHDPESYWSNQREMFRQLKYAMDKQGNRIQAIEFKSYEMDAYRKELMMQELSWENFANRFILFLGLSNNHGTNWWKPVGFILGTTLLFYWLIVICISDKIGFHIPTSLDDIRTSFEEFKNYSSAYFKMINPVFSFDKAFKGAESRTFWASLWEFLHRIVLAYLLFQMVSAFRKFVK